jgi:ABC-type uncharacterized transport system substrate-binding protein
MLQAITQGLEHLHIIENGNVPIPIASNELAPLWSWLADNAGGDSIRFMKDGVYNFQWDPEVQKREMQKLLDRLKTRKDAELIIVMGTTACRDAIKNIKDVALVTYASTNAVSSGLVRSAKDSGQDNVHAIIEPDRFVHLLKMIHEIFGFKRLGFPYVIGEENMYEQGRLRATCRELDVDFFTCPFIADARNYDKSFERLMACVRHLSETNEVDAMLVPFYNRPFGRKEELPDYLIANGIPSFSLSSDIFVAEGMLMGLDRSNFGELGAFEADVVRQILDGAKPREVNQIYTPRRTLVVNLTTAMDLGWNIPFDLFSSIGSVYKYHER